MESYSSGQVELQNPLVVISDIQGSYTDLKRFIELSKNLRFSSMLCLGDIVQDGSNYDEQRCIDLVEKNIPFVVRGNHDDAVVGSSTNKIQPSGRDYLRGLPYIINESGVVVFHSSIREPGYRLRSTKDIATEAEFIRGSYTDASLVLFGHTHERRIYEVSRDVRDLRGVRDITEEEVSYEKTKLHFINPGGLGLRYGEDKTFAWVDNESGVVRFFHLDEAEKMARMAQIAESFDSYLMPYLNTESIGWFLQSRNALLGVRDQDSEVQTFLNALSVFDEMRYERLVPVDKVKFLANYSKELAESVVPLRSKVHPYFRVPDPLESREQILRQPIKVVFQKPDLSEDHQGGLN